MKKDKSLGYRYDFLYLPKEKLSPLMIRSTKASLTFDRDGDTVRAYAEDETHLKVPREHFGAVDLFYMDFEIEDLSPDSFPKVSVSLTYDLRNAVQHVSKDALLNKGNGVLSLSCGKGKTVIALHAWAGLGVPAVVVVPTKDLAYQWKERIEEHTDVPEEDIGWITGHPSTWDWQKPICISTVHALAAASDEIPEKIRKHWGVIIFDEVHRLGAPYFNRAASVCVGRRWGLSATPFRKDGMDALYQSHIGGLLYQNLEHDSIPTVKFVRTGINLDRVNPRQLTDYSGEVNIPKLYTWLSKNQRRNDIIRRILEETKDSGRICLTLSERVAHVKELHTYFPKDSGVIHSKVKGGERARALKDNKIILAITQLARDGLDRSDLNTVLITMPFTDRGRFEQIIGRAQRSADPFIFILEDDIEVCRKMCHKLRAHLRSLKYPFGIEEFQ